MHQLESLEDRHSSLIELREREREVFESNLNYEIAARRGIKLMPKRVQNIHRLFLGALFTGTGSFFVGTIGFVIALFAMAITGETFSGNLDWAETLANISCVGIGVGLVLVLGSIFYCESYISNVLYKYRKGLKDKHIKEYNDKAFWAVSEKENKEHELVDLNIVKKCIDAHGLDQKAEQKLIKLYETYNEAIRAEWSLCLYHNNDYLHKLQTVSSQIAYYAALTQKDKGLFLENVDELTHEFKQVSQGEYLDQQSQAKQVQLMQSA